MKTLITIFLWLVGGFLTVLALFFGGLAIICLTERQKYGPGLMFADVEICSIIAVICAIPAIASMLAAWKMSKTPIKSDDKTL